MFQRYFLAQFVRLVTHKCLKLVAGRREKKIPETSFFFSFLFELSSFWWLCQSEASTPAVPWIPCCVGHSMGSAWIHWLADSVEIKDQQDTMCDFVSRLALLIGAASGRNLGLFKRKYFLIIIFFCLPELQWEFLQKTECLLVSIITAFKYLNTTRKNHC